MTEQQPATGSEPTGASDEGGSRHALPDGAERDPLIDMSRDPNPGVADHALPDDKE